MITTATSEMIPRLKELWKLCFHDEDAYIDFYYENRFQKDETLVYVLKDQVVAMLTLLPGFIVRSMDKQPVRYVYAVATHPEHRRKGYAAALIEFANQTTGKDYVGTFLVPASESLFPYYESLGYRVVSDKKILRNNVDAFLSNSNQDLTREICTQQVKRIEQLTAQEYARFRTLAFQDAGFLMWEDNHLNYLIKEFRFLEGNACKITLDQEEGALLYYEDQGTLFIKETTLTESGLLAAVKYLKQEKEFEHIAITLPKTTSFIGQSTPYVMAYADGFIKNEYVNLVLD